jgi:rRNA maturation endonuclease Nob1
MTELIECDGCARAFATEDALAMLAAIKGLCPTCGGTFRLALPHPAAPPTDPRPAS